MDVLVVSAFYRINSKRPFEAYLTRIEYYLKNTTCKILIFTTEDLVPVLSMRKNLEFCIVPFENFYSQQIATDDEYAKMSEWYSNSVAKKSVCSNLIKLYAEKHMFVNRAIDMYPNYLYYLWNDIGCIWGDDVVPYLSSYPSLSKIESLNIGDKICFPVRDKVSLKEYSSGIPEPRKQLDAPTGGLILGNKVAWRKFVRIYHSSLSYLKLNGHCWGNDEHVYFHMLCNNPNDITGVITYGFKLPIKDIYQCNSWNMIMFLISDLYNNPILKFEPIKSIDGIPTIKSATWGNHLASLDVTNIFRNKKDNSTMYIDFNLFPVDPCRGMNKFLTIEYENGNKEVVSEYRYLHIIGV